MKIHGFKTVLGNNMTETLDQERFNTVKILADMQTILSVGRAELQKLKKTTEEYVIVREKEAEERVLKVLKESRDALEETTKNHDELSKYNSELKAYANELKILATDITTLFDDFKEKMNKADQNMNENRRLVSDILTNIKIERIHVIEDRKMLERERQETNDRARFVIDREAMLKRGFDELKKLQVNKKDI